MFAVIIFAVRNDLYRLVDHVRTGAGFVAAEVVV